METQEQNETKPTTKRKAALVVPPVEPATTKVAQADAPVVATMPEGPINRGEEFAIPDLQPAEQPPSSDAPEETHLPSEETEFALQVGRLETRMRTLEARLMAFELQADALLNAPPATQPEVSEDSIQATMVGAHFNCPECGLRITTPALIATQGRMTGGYYEHPFGGSPRLGDQPCKLMGKKFYSPVVTLKFVNRDSNLTAKQ